MRSGAAALPWLPLREPSFHREPTDMQQASRRLVIAFTLGLMLCLLALVITSVKAFAQKVSLGAPTRVVVSQALPVGDIVVSLKDRRLYHVRETGVAVAYPIATPRDQDLWQGTQVVTMKREWPSWTPTEKMRRENPRLPTFVPGRHPLNPMGARALYLGHSYYRIHGTDAPWLIGRNVSKGCIRMHNEHVIELFNVVGVGTKVTVTSASLSMPTSGRPRKSA